MKILLLLASLCVGVLSPGRAQDVAPAVGLFARDKPIVLTESARQRVGQQIVALVQSSNFHSGPGDPHHIFTTTGVQQDYRDAVAAGEYLLMSFSPARKIRTTGGDVTAVEIVVGLSSPGGKNSVFTIDESGRVVSHAKYAGEVYVELKKSVAESRR